ncbi:hypothetical protein [uncultured Microbacterium sp.]|uniref:hypothetical protein n=1 Tax=uncultured Microbacterium sp. TaxID=191216 RepID=UPI003749307D
MLTRQAIILATIRTAVPAAIGWLLALLISRIPVVADIIVTIDGTLATAAPGVPGLTVAALLNAAAIGLVVAAYYWLVRQLGRRWPAVERWLLGSAQQPIGYAKQTRDGVWEVTSLPNPSEVDRETYQAALRQVDPHNPANFGTPGGHNQP